MAWHVLAGSLPTTAQSVCNVLRGEGESEVR